MKKLHIVLSSNERYMPGATVALAGIALNAKPETALHFHVFTEGVVRWKKAMTECDVTQRGMSNVLERD